MSEDARSLGTLAAAVAPDYMQSAAAAPSEALRSSNAGSWTGMTGCKQGRQQILGGIAGDGFGGAVNVGDEVFMLRDPGEAAVAIRPFGEAVEWRTRSLIATTAPTVSGYMAQSRTWCRPSEDSLSDR
ncbi:hypothetical protein QBC45DRAFT_473470 [Copromyces sp. CBS 386.78]|nr:hypothetical protein QBC45DRAFT_473470 [Copromyces sp. CBS 386.78]